jgi:hypothetical protein
MLRFAAIVAILGVAGCNRPARSPAERASSGAAARPSVRITHFYAGARQITDGDAVGFCYGVENARSVRLEPPLESLQPGFNRCFYLTPSRTATYKLVAEGFDGNSAAATVTVSVTPAAAPPPASSGPAHGLITLVFASAPEISPGEPVTLCYGTAEAVSVAVDPPVAALKPAARQCFQDRPERPSTYTFTAVDRANVLESDSVTVKVRNPN